MDKAGEGKVDHGKKVWKNKGDDDDEHSIKKEPIFILKKREERREREREREKEREKGFFPGF